MITTVSIECVDKMGFNSDLRTNKLSSMILIPAFFCHLSGGERKWREENK